MTTPNALNQLDLAYAASLLDTPRGADAAYEYLSINGYDYATFARGVVNNNTLEGSFAIEFMKTQAENQGVPLSNPDIDAIRRELAREYIDKLSKKIDGTTGYVQDDITFKDAKDIHDQTFGDHGLSPDTWTLNEPFKNYSEAEQEAIWKGILKDASNPWGDYTDTNWEQHANSSAIWFDMERRRFNGDPKAAQWINDAYNSGWDYGANVIAPPWLPKLNWNDIKDTVKTWWDNALNWRPESTPSP